MKYNTVKNLEILKENSLYIILPVILILAIYFCFYISSFEKKIHYSCEILGVKTDETNYEDEISLSYYLIVEYKNPDGTYTKTNRLCDKQTYLKYLTKEEFTSQGTSEAYFITTDKYEFDETVMLYGGVAIAMIPITTVYAFFTIIFITIRISSKKN